jgi:hypothetical protein
MYKLKCFEGTEPRIGVTDEFINRNKLSINQEAAKKLLEDTGDMFGFSKEVAIEFVDYDTAKPNLNNTYITKVESGEVEFSFIADVKEATQDFLDYMVFAWDKAMGERGISAGRSIEKLSAWMKILNRPDIADVLQSGSLYSPYGRPALRKACEMLEIKCPNYL